MIIRRATIEDLKGIAKVHVDTWRTAYKDIIPDSYLASLSYEKRETSWAINLNKEDKLFSSLKMMRVKLLASRIQVDVNKMKM